MATLDELKQALKAKLTLFASPSTQKLSDAQYDAGFQVLKEGSKSTAYQSFIIPQLVLLLDSILTSRTSVSVLEVGPGPDSVLGNLPDYIKRRIKKYTAFEPNESFATRLDAYLDSDQGSGSPFLYLDKPPEIIRASFEPHGSSTDHAGTGTKEHGEKYDLILFCHSMYGMKPRNEYLRRALDMLVEQPEGGMVVVFHRDCDLRVSGLVCHRTASYPAIVRVPDEDVKIDQFAAFISGFEVLDADMNVAMKAVWRKLCRTLGCDKEAHPGHLTFASPEIMMAYTRHATALSELYEMSSTVEDIKIKNREARLHQPAAVVSPVTIEQIQQCVRWALEHELSLTIVGGTHSGQCLVPNVVAVDMRAFNKIHILPAEDGDETYDDALVVVESGCNAGDVIRKTLEAGLTIPMGSRPSVGAGLWLQGGIGHLARIHGLACDNVVGAVVVSVATGKVFYVGDVPSQYQPADAERPDNEKDLLWAIKGAGTNVGIVVSVVFNAFPARIYELYNWVIPTDGSIAAETKLRALDKIASQLPTERSVDVYLFWAAEQLQLGVAMYDSSAVSPRKVRFSADSDSFTALRTILGPEKDSKTADGVKLFETELYMSGMHGGHAGGKTSSFKRCVFLKHIGEVEVAKTLVAAFKTTPSDLCYLHLLHGGGAVSDVQKTTTAFGCRDWDHACVITGVWPRDQDGTVLARTAIQWVYDVAMSLLPFSNGAYGADLGPDPRDAVLALKAFGPNSSRLAHLKQSLDPKNVLAYACPLPKVASAPRIIFLITGNSCAGKDHCATIWASLVRIHDMKGLRTTVVSISDATKREYSAKTGADLNRLLHNRAYKEEHRSALTAYFKGQVRQRPSLPEDHFLDVLNSAQNVEVLFITGMRDETPVETFAHLVPDSKVVEVRVRASGETRIARGGFQGSTDSGANDDSISHLPTLVFDNDTPGADAAERFHARALVPFLHEDLRRLADMVNTVPEYAHAGVDFRNVLGISQQTGGMNLCTALLQRHFSGNWSKFDKMVCCEVGGLVFASALATYVDIPLVLIREAGKVPPPTISVRKSSSHISSATLDDGAAEKRMEMSRDAIPKDALVVVVDDVLATGKTLVAVLQLLEKAGVAAENIHVLVVAEFPVHRGRQVLRKHGYGKVRVQSLLVFGGA